jgi:eukaryotic-like serine/threonine-protein kinase
MADATAEARKADQPGEEGLLAADTVIAERYRILGLLGKGGMGAVYRAEHVLMRKTVALKVLHRELLDKDEIVARFEREAVAAGRIQHVNVATASDFGKLDDGSYYLVLEYVDGQCLRALLDAGPITHARALGITRQIALGLRSAHELGIVHRDLKPDNVMLVAEANGKERVKVLDFGIARVSFPDARADATQLTRVGVIMGTVAYMSPEQALGQRVDGRADLYSLGVMLYEMIKGELPFQAELASQVLARQLTEAPPPLPPDTPAPLASLVLNLMEKSADKRPATAADVIKRLDALSVTPSGEVHAPKLESRRRFVIAAAVAGVVALVAWFALSGDEASTHRAARERVVPAPAERGAVELAPGTAEPAVELSAAPPVTPAPPGAATSSKPSPSAKADTKAGGKKKPGASDADGKRRTGPGGIYIPPPDKWF